MENETKMITEAEELMEALCEEKELELLDGCSACEECGICPTSEDEKASSKVKEKLNRTYQAAKEKYAIAKDKCVEAKNACRTTAGRVLNDLKETAGNPYIKYTTTRRLEVYRNAEEETPVDVFENQKTETYSLRTLALIGTASVLFTCATKYVAKQIAKKIY